MNPALLKGPWIPIYDSLGGDFIDIRRFSSFRAYHDSGDFHESETINNSRLIGRSVWNTRWFLVIPASTLHSDVDEGLQRFIHGMDRFGVRDGNGVSDIKLFFQTYSYTQALRLFPSTGPRAIFPRGNRLCRSPDALFQPCSW